MALNYSEFRQTARSLIKDTFGGKPCTVNHLAGGTSSGVIVFPTTDNADASIAEVGTIQTKTKVGYVDDVATEICVGDTITTQNVTYRVRDVREYKPAAINCAYRVTLDV